MDKLRAFFFDHSFKIMIAGFILSAAGIVFYAQMQHKNDILRKVAFCFTAAGIGLWLIGRVGIILGQRRARKMRSEMQSGSLEKEDS